ncbi:hypothetical protein CTAYLR_001643 [Chrysophaeum taylorii]|uniref:Glycosyltransferase family 92 protein n=1 Tax=Chrysophaeum taylorii TaxID=2483200 RepID=A0AAD7UBW7_9STRA|nr:hypothetical protein CTAYLR_001643 [Chrysophaeum taylorii]
MASCGVVTTTCVASGLETLVWWARYHVALGVRRIFLYVHDARRHQEELVDVVKEAMREIEEVVVLGALTRTESVVDVVAMQERDVSDAIARARGVVDWLFHFDDDELLRLTRPGAKGGDALEEALADVKESTFNLRLDNLEVQKLTLVGDSSYNYFEQELAFKLRVGLHADGSKVSRYHDPRFYVYGGNPASGGDGHTVPYLSYWNGKSAGRVAEPGLRPCGVHFFASCRGDAATAQERVSGLVLLHYPFCHLKTWRHKFNVLDATQRSDWGHYREARLAIVGACAPGGGGEPAIEDFYRSSVLGTCEETSFEETNDDDDDNLVALFLPREAAPQEWRSGVYERRRRGLYELQQKASSTPRSYLYNVPEKAMWLVGSTPGATTGAAVVYDDARRPADIRSTWSVYDGAAWTPAPDAAVGRLYLQANGCLFALVDSAEVLHGKRRRSALKKKKKKQRDVARLRDPPPDSGIRGGPDHAKLAAVVLGAIEAHGPYRERFWEAVTVAAGREPPGDVADAALSRALAAGARAMGTTAVAASLVAERASADHGASVRSAFAKANEVRAKLLEKHAAQDLVSLSMPGSDGVQTWRAGLYARVVGKPPTEPLYRRVREQPSDQDSYLYPVANRGMWLVGSTPGSTTGGLVAYDRATRPHDLKAPWHVYDGKVWLQAPDVTLRPARESEKDTKPGPGAHNNNKNNKRASVLPL